MDHKVLERIFTLFFTTRARGVGLGLSIVNSILEKHGGTSEIISEKGKGTTFKFRLPLHKPNEQEDEEY